jgi:hypothetical protein
VLAGDATELFVAEESLFHGGEWAQRIRGQGPLRAGLSQSVGANPNWDYHVSVWYSIDEQVGGLARLGVDPRGGTNPEGPDVVWSTGDGVRQWSQLAVRVGAGADTITIFLEALAGNDASVDLCFDDVRLIPIQPFCPPKPSRDEPVCVDFTGLRPGTQIPASFTRAGFTFNASDQLPQNIVAFSAPVGQSKLQIRTPLTIVLPWPASWVEGEVAQGEGTPIKLIAFDAQGKVLGQAAAASQINVLQTLEIASVGIVRLEIPSAPREAVLYRLCARREHADQALGKSVPDD